VEAFTMRTRLLVLVLLAPIALAQTEIAQQAIKDPSLSGPLADPGQVTLISSEKGTDARAEIGISIPGPTEATEWLLSLGAQASIEKKESVELADLSGLTNGTVADLRITRISHGKNYTPGNLIRTCRAFNATVIRTGPLPGSDACTDTTILSAIALRPAGEQGALRIAYAAHLTAGAVATCEAYNKANAGPPIASPATQCATETAASPLLALATERTKDCADTPAACWAIALAENIAKERGTFCDTLPDTITSVLKTANDTAITTAIATLSAAEQQRITSLYADRIAAGAIATCDVYNKAGAGPRINDPIVACATEADARTELARATTKTAGCKLASPVACWNALLEENITKQQSAFREQLNTDTDLWKLLRVTGESNCDLAALKARGNKLPSGTWYEQGLRDIGLAPSYLGLTLTVNSQSFAYAPGTILDPKESKEESKQGLGASLTYGRLFLGPQTYAGIIGTVERAYKGAKAIQVCEAVPDTTQTICKTVARQGPTQDDNEIATLEVRQSLGRFGFNPRVSYEFNDKAWLTELLTYLFTSKAKGLNGGVRLAYRSDDVDDNEDFSFGVFVGTAFQLFDK
jgi:hypothetical protein